jgi:tRNA pseudouridine38-40 synthase
MVAFGYHGDSFHGSQIQPDIRTVEGSLQKALKRLTWWTKGCLEICSRTDAGVSVRMNLACINLPTSVANKVSFKSMARAINDQLPVGMIIWYIQKVPQSTRSRKANSRHYLYRLGSVEEWPLNPNMELMKSACSIIEGRNNFTNLCKLEGDLNPDRIIDECTPWVDSNGNIIGISVKARAFLWNQVRRIASAIAGVVSGRISLDALQSALSNPHIPVDFGRANSDGLILWSISHDEIDEIIDSSFPDATLFTPRPDQREYNRWLSLLRYETSAFLEREWLVRIKLD